MLIKIIFAFALFYFVAMIAIYFAQSLFIYAPDIPTRELIAIPADIGLKYEYKFPKWQYVWRFDLYNVYNRRNPYFVYITQEPDPRSNANKFVAKQVSLLPFIPTLSAEFKF